MISDFYYNATYRHQVYLERLKSGEVNKVFPFLDEWRTSVLNRLSDSVITDYSRARLELLLLTIEQDLNVIANDQYSLINQSFQDIAVYEGQFEVNLLNETLKDFDTVLPAAAQLHSAVFTEVMSVRGRHGGKLLEPFIKDWQQDEIKEYTQIIRRGFAEGQTNQQMVQEVRSHSDSTKHHASAMVRTGIQHVANQARKKTLIDNGVKKYQWVSVLDSRTTPFCQRVDNLIFDHGKGPYPPAHINCRSNTIPDFPKGFNLKDSGALRSALNGPVSADLDYFDWLKKQPKQMQIDALGKKRADVFQTMTKENFIKLAYNKRFEPLTLDEMRKKEPTVFRTIDG